MRRELVIGGLAAIVLGALAGWTLSAVAEDPRPEPVPVEPTVPFRFLDGGQAQLGDYAGQVVLIDFWATWCAPCIDAFPALRRLQETHARAPFALISISTDEDREALDRVLAGHRVDWPQVWDPERELARGFGVTGYPTYLLIDHAGRMTFRIDGWSTAVERRLFAAVDEAVEAADEDMPSKAVAVANAF